MLEVISLGAGVQSTTMALMAAHGEIEPMPDAAIFADTGAEPKAVYEHLEWLRSPNVLPFPVYVVQKGDLERDSLDRRVSAKSGKRYLRTLIPAWLTDAAGERKAGSMGRFCTRDYKIVPLQRKLKELAGIRGGRRLPTQPVARSWIGISTDEAVRMKMSRERWVENRWPLIEQEMSRRDCLRWIERHDYPAPPRSACVFCPYHSPQEWQHLKTTDPDGFARAVAFERDLQTGLDEHDETTVGKTAYLWDRCEPLADADFEAALRPDQPDLFGNECEGMCGV